MSVTGNAVVGVHLTGSNLVMSNAEVNATLSLSGEVTTDSGSIGHGVYMSDSRFVHIEGSVLSNNQGAGLLAHAVSSGDAAQGGFIMADSTVSDNGLGGLWVQEPPSSADPKPPQPVAEIHGSALFGNIGFAAYLAGLTVKITDSDLGLTEETGLTLSCPEGTVQAANGCDDKMVPTPIGSGVTFGDGFHVCGAQTLEVLDSRLFAVPRYGGFLFNVKNVDITGTDLGGTDLVYRFMGGVTEAPAGVAWAEDAGTDANPVPEKILWGAPPSEY